MIALNRCLNLFLDSPTYGRDRANLISGFGIGTAALLLNAAVLVLVFPLLVTRDDPGFQQLSDHVGFGQLLALILLGGTTAFATLLIPLRLVTVFWEPRLGRYFDQIVLSGISPLRFVIGKALSQNLFLALTLFLLVPYLVLSITLGGVDLRFFAAGLFLVWLYCMSLAFATIWAALYLNELLAAILVIAVAAIISGLGCIPMQFQPFVLSPFPVLLHPVYASVPHLEDVVPKDYFLAFTTCAFGMSAFIGVALFAIYFGPLYGIIRENSTFGEVVRPGDSKRKRWFRFRLHIQRSSEIAFFYANRSDTFRRHEGLIRWGAGLGGLVLLSTASYLVFIFMLMSKRLTAWGQGGLNFFALEFHAIVLTIHSFGLLFAVILFSHAKNSTYLRLPFLFGKTVEVSRLDTTAFFLFLLFSTAASIATPFQFDQYIALPNGTTMFPEHVESNLRHQLQLDYIRISVEGSAVISVVGLVVYALQRLASLWVWMRTAAVALVAAFYLTILYVLPLLIAIIIMEIGELRANPLLANSAPLIASVSPLAVMVILFQGELGHPFPKYAWTGPFYMVHGLVFVLTILWIWRSGRRLRQMYMTAPAGENVCG